MSLDDLSAATVAFSLLIYLLLDGTDLGVGSVILFLIMSRIAAAWSSPSCLCGMLMKPGLS